MVCIIPQEQIQSCNDGEIILKIIKRSGRRKHYIPPLSDESLQLLPQLCPITASKIAVSFRIECVPSLHLRLRSVSGSNVEEQDKRQNLSDINYY